MTKKICSAVLAFLLLVGSVVFFPVVASDPAADYPELVITEIGVDQYGAADDRQNVNKTYSTNDSKRSVDPYEFIEIYNNSTQTVNVYDYMLAYQGASSTNADWFEHSIQCYTPFHPGLDWWDGGFTENDSYWKNTKDVRPVNPAYADGKIAPGEVFVAWVYNTAAHGIHATVEEFRAFWGVDANVKVFLLDGNDVDCKMNFSLKNQTTGTYLIMKQSERFPARYSADTTYYVEMDNTHHNYAGTHYADLDEVISWAVVDYRTEPLKSYAAANCNSNATTNFTLSYLPYTDGAEAANGYQPSLKKTLRRVLIESINDRAQATVGKLNDAQKAAWGGCSTAIVRCEPARQPVLTVNNKRPAILITELCADTKATSSFATNAKIAASPSADYFEFMEIYNNSEGDLNVYDYMIGYQGGGATGVTTYFERSVQEYTPILPGKDWFDAPYTAYDKYWPAGTTRPVNPEYEDGVLKAGEVAVIWFYNSDTMTVNATLEDFRTFWSVPDGVKVFLFDANSERERNFNIKNSATGTYYIMQASERFLARRSDDENYYVEADRTDAYYYYTTDNFETMPEIISWAVIDFGNYDPLYTLIETKGSLPNYTYHYVPFTGERRFINGFLTMTFDSQKRMHLEKYETSLAAASVGTLTDSQKAEIEKAKTIQ